MCDLTHHYHQKHFLLFPFLQQERNWVDVCKEKQGTKDLSINHNDGFVFRRQACVCAVRNAKNKALEVVQMFNQSLGPPVLIQEQHYDEFVGTNTETMHRDKTEEQLTFQQKIAVATVTVSVRIFIIFEIREKAKAHKRK